MRSSNIVNQKEYEMSTDHIELWHQRARPTPTVADFNVQIGCHFEEIAEMLETLTSPSETACDDLDRAFTAITKLALSLKQGAYQVEVTDREDFLDSLCDQQVTAIGVGHCAKMKPTEALRRVNASNWSKFDVNGKPLFNENGKITKGPNYHAPTLDGCY
jgi:hypothetical protein